MAAVNRTDHGRNPGLGAPGHLCQQVRHEVSATPLPTGSCKHCRYSVPQTQVCIRSHQFNTSEPSRRQRAKKRQPERTVLTGTNVHAHDLALALRVHSGCHSDRDVDYPTLLPDLLTHRVQPQIAVRSSIQWTIQEAVDHTVEVLADTRHLALGDTIAPQCLHKIVHTSRRHTLDVRLLDHSQKSTLTPSSRLQQRWEVAPIPELGYAQLHRADPGVPRTGAIPVAVGEPIGTAFTMLSADPR